MADRHALHKCRRGRCRRLRNAKVRRRLSFGDEMVKKDNDCFEMVEKDNGCFNGTGVFLYNFPVAV